MEEDTKWNNMILNNKEQNYQILITESIIAEAYTTDKIKFPYECLEVKNATNMKARKLLHDMASVITAARINLDMAILERDLAYMRNALQAVSISEDLIKGGKKEWFYLQDIADVVIKILREDISLNEVTIQVKADKTKILNNKIYITRLLVNLVKNSLEAVDTNKVRKEIVIKQILGNNKLVIIVEDNGKGMNTKILESVLMHTYYTKGKGVGGLGLQIVREIVEEKLNGKVIIESTEQLGTTVKLELPLTSSN